MKETDLYQPVCALFPQGNIYPEVVVYQHRPDIVIEDGAKVTVVEMKTSLSLAVIEQAYHWRNKCDLIYVAVPKPRKLNQFAVRLLTSQGIGVILVDRQRAYVHAKAAQQTQKTIQWSSWLYEFYKLNESGGMAGAHMTGYKFMIQCVRKHLEGSDCTLTVKDIVTQVDQEYDGVVTKHYRKPENALRNALTKYEKHWCRRVKNVNTVRFGVY